MKIILLIAFACCAVHGSGQQKPPFIIHADDIPAQQLMNTLASYYHVKVRFAPGFPIHSTSILGSGDIQLGDFSPARLARILSYKRVRIEFRDAYFYCKLLPPKHHR